MKRTPRVSDPLPSELREKQDILQHAVDALVSVSLDLGKQAKVMTLTDVHTPQAIPDNVKLDMALKPYKDRVMQLFEQEYQRRCEAAMPIDSPHHDVVKTEGYYSGVLEYNANLKQLSEGDNRGN